MSALLVLGIVGAALTWISLWPPHRPGFLALTCFFLGWLVSELPLHVALLELGLGGLFAITTGVHGNADAFGLALIGLSLLGMIHHVRLATQTTLVIERALKAGLGRDYHDKIDPELRKTYDPSTSWGRLAMIWPSRPRTIDRQRNVVYVHRGTRPLRLDIYKRRQDPPTNAPVFLYVHGGGWMIGNKGQQGRLILHELASAGWIGVSIEYRLSPRATFPDHLHDVKHAIAWVKQHIAEHGGDPSFVVIGGGSAGAHLASLAALTPNVIDYQRDFPEVDTSVQGCVAFYGIYDFADRARHFRHAAFRKLLLERIVMKRRFADAEDDYDRASPIFHAQSLAAIPPFMVLHGDRDSLAPLGGALRFCDVVRSRNGKSPLVWACLPGAQHAFEVFPSLRSVPAVHGVHRFCQALYSAHRAERGVRRTALDPA
ncbi:MAG TPA: alpha/beta hydrolase [Kofleriaceae bacterium]|nr:alpha/beta hydrolase [Kofleriaceae bacterium]